MSKAKPQHPNAALTPRQRRKMVGLVIDDGWTIEATADKFQVDAKTVTKWRDRFLTEGKHGLFDRSSRPKTSPNATPPECRRRIVELRKQRRWGAGHIGHEVGRAGSTVQTILVSEGLGRLDSGDRATAEPIVRYQRDRPGELVHVDVKKLAVSLTAAAGASTDDAKHHHRDGPQPATGSGIQPSMTGPGLCTPRSTPTNKPSPLSASGPGRTRSTTRSGSPLNASSATMVLATDRGSGGPRLKTLGSPRSSRGPTGHKRTARSNGSIGSCSRNGSARSSSFRARPPCPYRVRRCTSRIENGADALR
jgi:transposase-like protein